MYARLFRRVLFPVYESHLRGRQTLRYLEELEKSQWLPTSTLLERQWLATLEALAYAERNVPFYRRRFAEYGVRVSELRAPEDLVRLPLLTKADIRAHGPELVSEVFRGRLYQSGTAGSTGEPARFAYDHETYERRIAAAWRSDRWAGADLGEREAHVWGIPLAKEPLAVRAKKAVHQTILRRKFLSAWDLSPERLEAALDDLDRFEPRTIVGYTFSIFHLARHALARGRQPHVPRGVIATAEPLTVPQRETIERAFQAPVFDRYGCRETMLIAAECDRHEGKHLNVENLLVEILRDGRHAAPGQRGEVVLTDLVNRSMPLIRYKNEDVAALSDASCSCGRGLPLLASVEGRVTDLLVGSGGRVVSGVLLPYVFKDRPEVAKYQAHQRADRSVTVRVVPGTGFDEHVRASIERTMQALLGDGAVVSVVVVDDIPVTRAGKFRVAVSEANADVTGLGA